MRLILLASAVFLLLLPNIPKVTSKDQAATPIADQEKWPELQNLEAQFKKLDEEVDPLEVEVTGRDEGTGKIRITAKRKVFTGASGEKSAGTESVQGKPAIETLLNIDLSKIHVPDNYIKAKVFEIFSNPGSGSQCPGVSVQKLEPTVDYKVIEDYTYNAGGHKITAWRDFVYDRASIPRIFWVLIDKDSLTNVAPLFHDLLYRHGGVLPTNRVSPYKTFSREEADNLFFDLMTRCGVGYLRRLAAYKAVRTFSEPSWKKQ